MTKNKKLTLIVCSIATTAIVLTASTLALFTARTDSNFTAKAGTVTIDLKDLAMTNNNNINPGDNDPFNTIDAARGTKHEFTYNVLNTGNKSIRTRQTIILTAKGENSTLDARYLSLFIDKKEIESKTYVLEDNSETKDLTNVTKKVKAIKYTFISDVFDGKGIDITKGGNAEKETISNIIKQNDAGDVLKSYAYDFSLLREAANEYQGCIVDIQVVVEAMQYRNTSDSDWSKAGIVVREYKTSDVIVNTVPASDEDKKGNKFD